MSDREALLLQLAADVRYLQKSWDKANGVSDASMRKIERRADGMAANVEKAFGRIKLPNNLRRELNDFGRDLGTGLANGSRLAQVALAGVSAIAIKLAADAAEIESAFDVAFKGAAAGARTFADELSKRVGRDAIETREAMTRLQLVLTGTGVAAEQATEVVKQLVAIGIDAGSLFNTTDAEAFQKIISGISGEAEPLKAFGVVLTEAAVKAELLRLGFKGNAEQASEAAKSIARANLILKGLAVAQGDAERTAGSAANQTRALRAEFNAAARELGNELLPAFVKVTGGARDALHAFNELPGGVQLAGVAFLGLIAAGGPIAGLLANLKRVIDLAQATRAALAGVAAANGAAGAAGAAAGVAGGAGLAGLGAGAAIVGIPAIVGASVLKEREYRALLKNPGKATDQQLADAVAGARRSIDNLNRLDGGAAVKGPGAAASNLARIKDELATLNAEVARRAKAAGGSSPTVNADVLGGFTLSPSLQRPVAGAGGKGKTPKGESAEEKARKAAKAAADALEKEEKAIRDALSLRLEEVDSAAEALDLQASMARTAEERRRLELKLLDLADQRVRAEAEAVLKSKTASPAEKEIARRRVAGLDATRDAREAVVRAGTMGPLEAYLDSLPRSIEDTNEALQRLKVDGLESLNRGITDAILGAQSLGGVARNVFRQIAGDLISMFVTKNITGPIAGLLAGVPGFATGTRSAPGGLAWVGERGKELVNLPRGSQVIPNHALSSLGRGATQNFFADFTGAVVTEELMAQFKAYADQQAMTAAAAGGRLGAAQAQRQLARRSQQKLGGL